MKKRIPIDFQEFEIANEIARANRSTENAEIQNLQYAESTVL